MFSIHRYGHVGFSISDTVTEKVNEEKEKIEIEQNKENMKKGFIVGGIVAVFFVARWLVGSSVHVESINV